MPKDIMGIIPLSNKTETKEIFFTARIAKNGINEIRFSVFDKAKNYKTFSIQYINNIILN